MWPRHRQSDIWPRHRPQHHNTKNYWSSGEPPLPRYACIYRPSEISSFTVVENVFTLTVCVLTQRAKFFKSENWHRAGMRYAWLTDYAPICPWSAYWMIYCVTEERIHIQRQNVKRYKVQWATHPSHHTTESINKSGYCTQARIK